MNIAELEQNQKHWLLYALTFLTFINPNLLKKFVKNVY